MLKKKLNLFTNIKKQPKNFLSLDRDKSFIKNIAN